jgi:hypothetical protein
MTSIYQINGKDYTTNLSITRENKHIPTGEHTLKSLMSHIVEINSVCSSLEDGRDIIDATMLTSEIAGTYYFNCPFKGKSLTDEAKHKVVQIMNDRTTSDIGHAGEGEKIPVVLPDVEIGTPFYEAVISKEDVSVMVDRFILNDIDLWPGFDVDYIETGDDYRKSVIEFIEDYRSVYQDTIYECDIDFTYTPVILSFK